MSLEIEKKFLIKNENWKEFIFCTLPCRQGYLSENKDLITRVRIILDKAYLTIKGKQEGISRQEFEYEIPLPDAEKLLSLSNYQIYKTRFILNYFNDEWIVDVFEKNLKGLVLSEIELNDENQIFKIPNWIGRDVSTNIEFTNYQLAKKGKIPKLS